MCVHGVTQPDFPNVLGRLEASTAAFRAGLRPGDRITALGGRAVNTWHDIETAAEARKPEAPLAFSLLRGGAAVEVQAPASEARAVLGDMAPESSPAIVGNVSTGMPAYRGGVKEGDHILAVDGHAVERFEDIGQQLRGKVDKPVKLTLLRAGRRFDITVSPISADGTRESQRGVIGIEAPRGMTWVQHFTFSEAVSSGYHGTVSLVQTVYEGMWLTVSRPVYYRDYVGGPIFIGQMARDSARKGLDNYLYLLAMINLAIMAFNLLPVPLLDGGHILLALLEAVRRRALSARAYLNFQKVGLVLVGHAVRASSCPRTSCARSSACAPSTALPGRRPRLSLRPIRAARAVAPAAALLALLAFPASPGAQQGELPEELRTIASVRFRGLHHLSRRQLSSAGLRTRTPSLLPWRERPTLRHDYLRADSAAIVSLYRHYGYLDADREGEAHAGPRSARGHRGVRCGARARSRACRASNWPVSGRCPTASCAGGRCSRSRGGRSILRSCSSTCSRSARCTSSAAFCVHVDTLSRRGVPDTTHVAVHYDVDEGPQYRVGRDRVPRRRDACASRSAGANSCFGRGTCSGVRGSISRSSTCTRPVSSARCR